MQLVAKIFPKGVRVYSFSNMQINKGTCFERGPTIVDEESCLFNYKQLFFRRRKMEEDSPILYCVDKEYLKYLHKEDFKFV